MRKKMNPIVFALNFFDYLEPILKKKISYSVGPYWCLGGAVGPYWCLGGAVGPYWCLGGAVRPYWCLDGAVGPYWCLGGADKRTGFTSQKLAGIMFQVWDG